MAVQIAKEQIKNNAIDNNKLDLSANYTFTGTLAAATPSSDSDVAIKSYVDGLVSGLHWKEAVEAATTANITLSGTQTVDGVSLSAGDRILIKDQSDATENGIYVVAAGAWSRATDMDAGNEFPAAAVFVKAGTVNDNLGFTCTNDSAPELGTDNINFTQFNGAANIVAGDGLAKSGNTLSVNVDDSSLEIASDSLRVKDAGISNDMLAGSIANSKLANSTISGVALGSNLSSLSAGNGIAMTSYNGSAAVSDLTIDLDGSSLTVGAGGIKISTAGVGTLQLADASVTAGKLASSAVETAKINDLAVTEGKLAAAAVATAKIADSAVTNAKLAGSITAGKINLGDGLEDDLSGNVQISLDGATLAVAPAGLKVDDGGITSTQLATDAVTNAKIADNAVDTAELVDDAVTSAKIADGAVVSAALGDGSVVSSKVADAAISAPKLNFFASYETLSAGDGSATTFDASAAADATMLGGAIVFRNGLAMGLVESSPSGQDQYTLSATGGSGSTLRVTFGTAPNNGDQITVMYFSL
jgi:hypothetical protein